MMPLERLACSLELAKRLKELGVKQTSVFWWHEDANIVGQFRVETREAYSICSAFTVGELIERLDKNFGVLERLKSGKFGAYIPNDCAINGIAETPVNALAMLYANAIEAGLVKV